MRSLVANCKPRDSVFDKARRDTVLDLTDLVQNRIDPDAFFRENHITEGMRILLTEGFRRLEGKTIQGVFKLTQAMGGTHVVVAGVDRRGVLYGLGRLLWPGAAGCRARAQSNSDPPKPHARAGSIPWPRCDLDQHRYELHRPLDR